MKNKSQQIIAFITISLVITACSFLERQNPDDPKSNLFDGIPQNVRTTDDSTDIYTITITWDEMRHALSYQVYRAINDPNGRYVQIKETIEKKYEDRDVEPGKIYYYKIVAKLTSGKLTDFSKCKAGYIEQLYQLVIKDNIHESDHWPIKQLLIDSTTDIQALSPPAGYEFDYWSLPDNTTDKISIKNSKSDSTKICLKSSGDTFIVANYKLKTYMLEFSVNTHGITIPDNIHNLAHDTTSDIYAIPNEGYHFSHWSIENSRYISIEDVNASHTRISLHNGNAKIQAVFKKNIYLLTIINDVNGTTDPSGDIHVAHGDKIAIKSIAQKQFGYRTEFNRWEVVQGHATFSNPTKSNTDVTIKYGDAIIKAIFDRVPDVFPPIQVTVGNQEIGMNWDDVSDFDESYTLLYTDDKTEPSDDNGIKVPLISRPYSLSNIRNGLKYQFFVNAHYPGEPDISSKMYSTIPLSLQTLTPRVFGDLNHIKLEWQNIDAAKQYDILRSTEKKGTYVCIATQETTTYIDNDVEAGLHYYYKIRMTDDTRESDINSAQVNHNAPMIIGTYDTPGLSKSVTISGDYAYVADGQAGFQIIDITDPLNLKLIGTYNSPGYAEDVTINGDYAYVADAKAGLQIINISNPSNPELTGTCDTPGYARDVTISGSYAYVADEWEGLQIINISNPSNPELTGTYKTSDQAMAVKISGDYAYVADRQEGLQIINITDPSKPHLTSTYNTHGLAHDVTINGNYAYVADRQEGLQIIDITDPSNPQLTDSFDTHGSASGVTISGNYAYVVDSQKGLQMINITDPSDPHLAGTCNTPGSAKDVIISGNYAYVADNFDGLQVINISSPTNPHLVSTYDTPSSAQDLAINNNHAYVVDSQKGLQIINITDPSNLQLTGTYHTSGTAHGIVISGNYAYMIDSQEGLQVINITDPSNPQLTGTYNISEHVQGVTISGEYAYLANNPGMLQIINISNPSNPYLAGTYHTSSALSNVTISGNYAYVTDSYYGLQIINISDPSNPELIGTCDTTGYGFNVTISGDYAYIAGGKGGLITVNTSDPANPKLTDIYYTPGYNAHDVIINGNYAYVTDGQEGLQIIDITIPSYPQLASSCDTPGNAYDIEISGDYAYVTDAEEGLQVIRLYTE